MLEDPGFQVIRRGVDARWHYQERLATRLDGFNPFHGGAFLGSHSRLLRWLPHRRGSARPFNEGDALVSEVLFAAHDYLHSWTCQWIARLRPELGFGWRPITAENLDDMLFCHLLGEAVATVGLDYWYLSTVELGEEVPIGTLQRGLTVSYRERLRDEYRRFNPRLAVQHPSFLGVLTRFYCDGILGGFDRRDLRASPALEGWLAHELHYGELQRSHGRAWFAYLSAEDLRPSLAEGAAPVAHGAPWKRRLVTQLAERLWAKVKEGDPCRPGIALDRETLWTAPESKLPDFRFLNLNRCEEPSPALARRLSEPSFSCLMRQYVARFDVATFPVEALGVFNLVREERDLGIGRRLLAGLRRVSVGRSEPRDIFLLS